tara:strand:+ start:2410 stop:4176 length:1767 start_codon:yes stop_codon:yes gene_type:complete
MKNKFQVVPFFYFSFSIIFWILMIIPNSDLVLGRWALHMDEQILFDHLKRIYHFDSKEQLFSLIYQGGWANYGPIFFNMHAIVCLLPKIFYGDLGVIFGARMSNAFFLIASLNILTLTFLKNWMLRFFCFLVIINVPGISYLMCLPKPESIQLFFLSLFFYFFKKNEFSLSKSYWIFLGISFGAKISAFLFLVFLPIFAFSYVTIKQSLPIALIAVPKTIFFIFLGLTISSFFLFPNVFLSFMIYIIVKGVLSKNIKKNLYLDILLILALITLNILWHVILNIFFSATTNTFGWFRSTFLATQNPADHESINFFSWLNYFFTTWLGDSIFLNVSIVIFSFLIILKGFYFHFKDRHLNKNNYGAFLVLFLGIITIVTLFVKVKRLWLFYLTPWIICVIIGVFSTFEILLKNNSSTYRIKHQQFLIKFITALFLISVIGIMQNWFFKNLYAYKEYSSRTKSEFFQKEKLSYLTILDFLNETSEKKGYPITVAYDSLLPIPDKNNRFFTHRFFEPFEKWNIEYDAIILSERIKKRVKQIPDPKTYEYNQLLAEKAGYEKHVLSKSERCSKNNCYKLYANLENGGEILVRIE